MIRHFLIDTDLSYKEQKDIFSLAKKIKKINLNIAHMKGHKLLL